MELQVRLQVLRCSRFQGFDETFDYEIEYEGVLGRKVTQLEKNM